jgi:hypothetical protein
MSIKKIDPKLSIPLATLGLIFIPLLLMSIRMKAFWIDSPYDYPFVLIPAVFIGDPLLLPPLNYLIYLALKQVIPLLQELTTRLIISSCLLLSIIFNAYTHYLWSHDEFTGFMDPTYGTLSVAGWWHYVISVLQIAYIFIFMMFWVLTVKKQTPEVFKAFEQATYVLIAFNIVNLSGTFVGRELLPDVVLTNFVAGSTPLALSLFLFFRMRRTFQLPA